MQDEKTFFDTMCSFVNTSLPAILLAMFGRTVQIFNNNKRKEPFSWRWFLIGNLTAGFVGYIMLQISCELGISNGMTSVVVAISGYSANDILKALRDKLIKKVKTYGE